MKLLTIILAGFFFFSSTTYGASNKNRSRSNIKTVNITKPNIQSPGDMQVNSFTGNLLHQRQDVFIPGRGLPINVTFSYNSGLSKNDWGLGKGWTSTFNMMYERKPGYVIVRGEDGRKDSFAVSGMTYISPIGVFDNLSEYTQGKFLLETKHGMKYFFDDSTHGKLTKIQDPNNNTITFAGFAANQPTLITDANGRSIRLGWSGGQLAYVLDSIASPPRMTSYLYVRGNLVQVTDPMNNVLQYQYDARSRLVRFTDELSQVVFVTYNDSGAVSSVTTPGGPPTSLSLAYDPPSRQTVAEEVVSGIPQTTTYTFDLSDRIIHIQGNCCGFDVQYQYDAQNNITQRINANGIATNYTYDSRGNLLSETDAFSQTASWSYEPTYNRVTSATDKRGNTTTFSYDSYGNLLSISRPLAVTESFTYDAFGNPTSATDGRGKTTSYSYNANGYLTGVARPIGSQSFSYDNSGNLTSWTDANGHTTTYAYDVLDRRVSMTNGLGGTRLYLYGGASNLVQETDENGRNTSYTYDALDRVITVSKPAGTATFVRDAHGNVKQSIDFNGNLTSYTYDTRNRLISVTNPLGQSHNYVYDDNGNVLTETDFNGNTTSYIYDMLDRMIQTTDALGNPTTMTYDANNNVVTVTDANGHVTTHIYDALDRQVQTAFPIGNRSYTYDNNGNLVNKTDPNGHTTTSFYDANNRLTSVLDPLLHTTSFAYDPDGNVVSTTNPNGLTSTYTYDALHRMISASNPLLEATTHSYDPVGNRISSTLPHGNTFSYSYDASDRMTSVSDGLGLISSHTYDANSNMLSETDANFNTTQYVYDPLDRLTSIIKPGGQSTLYSYDNNSNILSATDGAGNPTTYTYDAVNRRLTETFPGGLTTTCGYDAEGNLISILDARGNITGFALDVMDRVTQISYANGSSRTFAYDPAGNLASLLDQNGTTITFAYDAMNRMTSRNGDAFTYDNAGRLTSANNAAATVSFTYDAADRVLGEALNGKTTSYSYNIPGLTVTTTFPGGRVVENTMNHRLLTSALQSGTSVANYAYDGASRMVSQLKANGISTSHTYNNNDWTTSIIHAGPVTLAGFNYTFDNRGFRSTVQKTHRPTHSEQYVYDASTRMTQFKEGMLDSIGIPAPLTQTQFTFDAIGNRINSIKDSVATSYTANSINAYTSVSGGIVLSPTYDANGNMKSMGLVTLNYDYMDNLSGAFDDSSFFSAYKYDALGRRVQKEVNGTTTNYFYDGDVVIEDRDDADVVTATYVHGQGVDDMVSMTTYSPTRNYYYHHNSLGSVVAMTDDSGMVAERYEYDAFGKVSIYDSAYTARSTSAIGNKYLFTGRELDAETGLYYYRARHYNPLLGRFMQQDPLLWGDAPDLRNGYSYTTNNPINYTDPSGEGIAEFKDVFRPLPADRCTMSTVEVEDPVLKPKALQVTHRPPEPFGPTPTRPSGLQPSFMAIKEQGMPTDKIKTGKPKIGNLTASGPDRTIDNRPPPEPFGPTPTRPSGLQPSFMAIKEQGMPTDKIKTGKPKIGNLTASGPDRTIDKRFEGPSVLGIAGPGAPVKGVKIGGGIVKGGKLSKQGDPIRGVDVSLGKKPTSSQLTQ